MFSGSLDQFSVSTNIKILVVHLLPIILGECPTSVPKRKKHLAELRQVLDFLGWMMGFEPTTTGITIQDSTAELHPPLIVVMMRAFAFYEHWRRRKQMLLCNFLGTSQTACCQHCALPIYLRKNCFLAMRLPPTRVASPRAGPS